MLTNFNQSNGTLLVDSFADLRALTPQFEGQIVKLTGWNSGSNLGAGEFIGSLSSATDDGGFIASNGGNYHWERKCSDKVIDLNFYGITDNSDITTPLQNAITYSRTNGFSTIKVPENTGYYTISGGIIVNTDNYPLTITFGSGRNFKGTKIYQTSTNGAIGITVQRKTTGSMWNNFILSGASVSVSGSGVSTFIQIEDSWHSGLENCYLTGYTTGSAIVVQNTISWTENFFIRNVMVRESLNGITFIRVSTGTATDSFYGTDIEGYYFQHGTSINGASYAITVGDGTSAGVCRFYASKVSMGGWLEGKFGVVSSAIRVMNYSSVHETSVAVNYDGIDIANEGENFSIISATGQNASVDIDLKNYSNQVPSYTLTAPTSGGTATFSPWTIIQNPSTKTGTTLWSSQSPRPLITTRGAKVVLRGQFTGTGSGSDSVLTITGLPIMSTFLVKLRIFGTNYEFSQAYTINVHSINFIAGVFEHQLPNVSTTVSSSTATSTASQKSTPNVFYARPYNNNAGNNYIASGGGQFDVVFGSTLFASTNTFFTEIEIVQI